jgi:hypothetical protein
MESIVKEGNTYDSGWFKERAMSGLKKIDGDSWDYSDSLLLYLPGHDETYESVQDLKSPYHEIVTAPEREYLNEVAPKVANILPQDFDYIDLGPGTEHKEQFFFDELKNQGKVFSYHPVDISERYLTLASDHAERQGTVINTIRSSFEELPNRLPPSEKKRFVSLGLTYCNYNPSEILQLLKAIRGEGGNIFINSQIRNRIDIEKLRLIYQEVAIGMSAPKLQLLGLNPETDLSGLEVTDEVKVWYTITNPNEKLEEKGVETGDRILVFQSLRPTLEELDRAISREFESYELLDTGGSFVGIVTK